MVEYPGSHTWRPVQPLMRDGQLASEAPPSAYSWNGLNPQKIAFWGK